MSFLPSPPSSPLLTSGTEKVVCGSCQQELGIGWFCSQCHTKCSTCSRFLTDEDYCTRCWLYNTGDVGRNNISLSYNITETPFVTSFRHSIPSPTNGNSSLESRQSDSILPLNSFTQSFVS